MSSSTAAKKKQAQNLQNMARIRKTPLVLTGILLELLRSHFGNSSERFQWVADEVDTKIIIEPIHQLNFDEVQKRPAVYVSRGPYQYATRRLAINDQRAANLATGAITQQVLVSCPMQMIPVGRNMGEVELLAEEVSEVFLVFKSLIRQDYGFTRFDLAGISQLGVAQEDREYFTAPITVNTEFTETWSIEPFAPKLNKIMSDIRVKVQGFPGSLKEDCLSVVKPEPRAYSPELNTADPCELPEFCPMPPEDLDFCGPEADPADEKDENLGDGYGEGEYS